MVKVYLSIGSNIEKKKNITQGLAALTQIFVKIECSSVYESEAVGFNGDNFYNLVVGLDTELNVSELSKELRLIEAHNGRNRGGPKFSARTLDIDILTYNDFVGIVDGVKLPREEITKNAFVLLPLSELAPLSFHPALKQSYLSLWQAYDKNKQKLWPVQL